MVIETVQMAHLEIYSKVGEMEEKMLLKVEVVVVEEEEDEEEEMLLRVEVEEVVVVVLVEMPTEVKEYIVMVVVEVVVEEVVLVLLMMSQHDLKRCQEYPVTQGDLQSQERPFALVFLQRHPLLALECLLYLQGIGLEQWHHGGL